MKMLIYLLFLNASLNAFDCEIMMVVGKVEIKHQKKEITAEKGKRIPVDSEITTGAKSAIQISTPKGSFKIKENNEVQLDKLVDMDKFISSSPTKVAAVRSLYEDLQIQLNQESKIIFDRYVASAGGKIENYKDWKLPMESAFSKLVKASGRETFSLEYAVVSNPNFNAAAFPGGQFLIHSGTLDILDQKIDASLNKNSTDQSLKNLYREYYIASILSHEMAHFLHQHSAKAQLRIIGKPSESLSEEELSEASQSLENVQFSQNLEFEADLSGFINFKKAGYDPKWMMSVLNILKEIHANSLKSNKNSIPYFQSHPSPNERLARIPSDDQEWYKFLTKMERIFADIQLGSDLSEAVSELDNALRKYPDNLDFMKAKSAALHKIWLNTVPLEDQILRAILDVPAFRDDMVVTGDGTRRGGKEIPGDKASYFNALKIYREVFKKTVSVEPGFLSNYASLLVYSPDVSDIERANNFAEQAFKSNQSIQTGNNLGLVYFISEKKNKAMEVYSNLASVIEKRLQFAVSSDDASVKAVWENFKKETAVRNMIDPNYTSDQFTPIMNLALIKLQSEEKAAGKLLAERYLSTYENDSEWSKYLAKTADIKREGSDKKFEMDGITVGDTEEKLFKEWGMPNEKEIENLQIGALKKRVINFHEKSSVVHTKDGKISMIRIQGESRIKLNKAPVLGFSSGQIRAFLGVENAKSKSHQIYYGQQKLRINLKNDKAIELILY